MENSKGKNSMSSAFGSLRGNIFSYPLKIQQHHNIYLYGEIGPQEDHIDKIETIRTAPADDVIRLIINTNGGYVTTMISYMQAIRESKATVICHAEGQVASAGTFIWLSGDEHSIADHTQFMFHNMQYGSGGDAANVAKHVKFNTLWSEGLMKDVYSGFLTEDEMSTISNAGEVYLSGKEVSERMSAFYAHREKKELDNCQCEECQEMRKIEEIGYYTVELNTGKQVNVPVDGILPESLLQDLDINEWRELANKLEIAISTKDSRKRIREKIIKTLTQE